MKKVLGASLLLAVVLVIMPRLAQAADDNAWPSGTVRVVVPYPPGGGTDIVARIVVDELNTRLGRHFIVENKDGATTLVGTEAVARSHPDGGTLLYTSTAYSINPSLQRHMSFDTAKSFTPIALTAFHPFVLLVSPSLGVSTLAELITLAKKEPGKINYASVGVGSSQHLEMELLKKLAGIDMTHVPFRGSAPAMNDLLGGHISLMWNGLSPSVGLIRDGKLRALVVDSKSRVAVLKDVPTIAEAGLHGFDIVTWSGLFAPAGTPKPIVNRLEVTMNEIIADPAVHRRLTKLGLQPGGLIGADFRSFLANDMNAWAKLVAATGARIE